MTTTYPSAANLYANHHASEDESVIALHCILQRPPPHSYFVNDFLGINSERHQ